MGSETFQPPLYVKRVTENAPLDKQTFLMLGLREFGPLSVWAKEGGCLVRGDECAVSQIRGCGFLQADGYSGFGPLYETANGQSATVTEVACWAHVRRKFYDIHVATSAPIAGDALARIGQLFDIERAAMGRSPQVRARIRQGSARPVIDDLAAFFD